MTLHKGQRLHVHPKGADEDAHLMETLMAFLDYTDPSTPSHLHAILEIGKIKQALSASEPDGEDLEWTFSSLLGMVFLAGIWAATEEPKRLHIQWLKAGEKCDRSSTAINSSDLMAKARSAHTAEINRPYA